MLIGTIQRSSLTFRVIKLAKAADKLLPFVFGNGEAATQMETGLLALKEIISVNPDNIKNKSGKSTFL